MLRSPRDGLGSAVISKMRAHPGDVVAEQHLPSEVHHTDAVEQLALVDGSGKFANDGRHGVEENSC